MKVRSSWHVDAFGYVTRTDRKERRTGGRGRIKQREVIRKRIQEQGNTNSPRR